MELFTMKKINGNFQNGQFLDHFQMSESQKFLLWKEETANRCSWQREKNRQKKVEKFNWPFFFARYALQMERAIWQKMKMSKKEKVQNVYHYAKVFPKGHPVMIIWKLSDPLPPHAKMTVFRGPSNIASQKWQPPPPTSVTSFMDDP